MKCAGCDGTGRQFGEGEGGLQAVPCERCAGTGEAPGPKPCRVKVGDEVRIVGAKNWGTVMSISEDGRNAQVLTQRPGRNTRGAFKATRRWYPAAALWTRDDDHEARKR